MNPFKKPTPDQVLRKNTLGTLRAMEVNALHVYGGTVPQATIDKRRAKNRAARKARRLNRG